MNNRPGAENAWDLNVKEGLMLIGLQVHTQMQCSPLFVDRDIIVVAIASSCP
jgi:hypothetical protein